MTHRPPRIWVRLAIAFVAGALSYLGLALWLGLTLGYPPPDPGVQERNSALAVGGLVLCLVAGLVSLAALAAFLVAVWRRFTASRP